MGYATAALCGLAPCFPFLGYLTAAAALRPSRNMATTLASFADSSGSAGIVLAVFG